MIFYTYNVQQRFLQLCECGSTDRDTSILFRMDTTVIYSFWRQILYYWIMQTELWHYTSYGCQVAKLLAPW